MIVIGIDPGTKASGVVVYDGFLDKVLEAHKALPNQDMSRALNAWPGTHIACEWIEHYGSTIHAGADVYWTCRWIGRFEEQAVRSGYGFKSVTRREVKLHLCGSMRAKDKDVRTAIVDRFGGEKAARGRKAEPGPLFGVSSHAWPALAVVLTYLDNL